MELTQSDFDRSSRREFLTRMAGGTLAVGAAENLLAQSTSSPNQQPKRPGFPATADTLIVLWMAGGMAHTETFDPKRYVPFESGMKADDVLCTFPAIRTAVDGIEITEGFEKVASVLDRGTLIRSHVLGDLGTILHSRHQYHWHTGYEPPQNVAAPHLGAWIAHALGPKNPAIPAFIDIGQSYEGNGESEELKAFQTGGCLGAEFNPFRVPDPRQAVNIVKPPAGMSLERFRRRYDTFRKMVADGGETNGKALTDAQRNALLRSVEQAHRLMDSTAAKAFDLSLEPKESFDTYNTCKFGLGCLLARRLVEEGARFIEVTTEYGPFLQWDTHDNGHTRLAKLKSEIDAPIAQLILDLERRGLLDRTMIVLASEFSRDCLLEGKPEKPVGNQVDQPAVLKELKHYGMHRHFTGASSVLMFGGGAKQGFLYGKTAAERPCTTIENPINVMDLHATMLHTLGIAPDYQVSVEQRPFYVTQDGHGQVRASLLQ
ncbi:MAG: DUF1501 domain-containing protein [Planctomycetaceae bacterium]